MIRTKLKDLISIKHGFAFSSDYFSNIGDYKVLTPGHFREEGGFRNRSEEKFYVGDFPREYILQEGDLLVVMTEQKSGLLGSPVFVPRSGEFLHNQRLGLVVIDRPDQLDKKFLFWVFNFEPIRKRLFETAGGMKVRHTSPAKICSLEYRFPPLPEQKKIAEILGGCDEAIEAQERLIALKQQRKKGLMQQLLTGKTRFPQFAGKPWREVRLGDVFSVRKESNREDLELLSVTAEGGVVKRDGLNRKDTSSEDKSKYKRVCPGDIAYNTMRMWQGVSGLSKHEGIVSPAYTIVTPIKSIDPIFSAHFFKLPETVSLFHRYSQGLVRDTLNLKYPNFKVIKVTIPEHTEQEVVGQALSACDQEITLQQNKLKQLQLQKKGLMQQLLTGKVRVKV